MNEIANKRRRYDDACAAAHALDLIGDRWMLLVIREMMFGPRRFGDIRRGLPGISANVLTQRLEELESVGILIRRKLPPPAGTQVYELTEWGLRCEPIFVELGRWACGSPGHDPTRPFSAASMFLSFRTMIDREASANIDATFGFRIGEERYVATMQDGTIRIVASDPDHADVIFTAVPEVMAGIIYGGAPIEAMEKDDLLQIEGDRSLAERFVTLFPLSQNA
ncbi:winged helix-turn-helix transcriptional regulator [Pararhizobium sp. IMCC21322]|uniref:winged helix-turn-helix transcriptional regulator n=1 Tax=Pararhizobium sp. IMCC21322 TaxID=3067903 RepID=UPI0027408B26|nr:winged helix-turn-helix transcriptional regulator [Pararhizobium sp. IMCC21322]